jgi:hypothetical protein
MGISLTEQGYDGLDHYMILVWDAMDEEESMMQMEENNKRGLN